MFSPLDQARPPPHPLYPPTPLFFWPDYYCSHDSPATQRNADGGKQIIVFRERCRRLPCDKSTRPAVLCARTPPIFSVCPTHQWLLFFLFSIKGRGKRKKKDKIRSGGRGKKDDQYHVADLEKREAEKMKVPQKIKSKSRNAESTPFPTATPRRLQPICCLRFSPFRTKMRKQGRLTYNTSKSVCCAGAAHKKSTGEGREGGRRGVYPRNNYKRPDPTHTHEKEKKGSGEISFIHREIVKINKFDLIFFFFFWGGRGGEEFLE